MESSGKIFTIALTACPFLFPRFATVVGLALYGAHRAAAGFSPTSKHRALAGVGVDKFTKRLKTWLEDFF